MAASCLCLKCGGTFSTADGRRGSDVPCPKCGAAVRVPPAAATPPTARRIVKAKPVAADAERWREPDARHDDNDVHTPARFPTAGVVGIAAAVGVGMLAVIVGVYIVTAAGRPDAAEVMPAAVEPVVTAVAVSERAEQPRPTMPPPIPPTVPEPPPTPEPEPERNPRVNAGEQWTEVDGVRVALVALEIPDTDRIMLTVSVSVADQTRKVDYRSWRNTLGIGDGTTVVDDFGNTYRQVVLGLLESANMEIVLDEMIRAKGAGAGSGAVSAGRPRMDFIVVERPIASVTYLNVDLNGSHVGVREPFRFRVAKASWTPKPVAPPAARAAPVDQLVPLTDDMRTAAVEQLRKAVANRGKDADYLKRLKTAKTDLARAEAGVINRNRKSVFTPPDKSSPIHYPTPEAKADAVAKAKAALDKLTAEATGPIADLGKYAPPLTAKSELGDVGRFFDGGGYVVQVLGDREARIRPGKADAVYVVKGIDTGDMVNGFRADVPGVFYVAGRRGSETVLDNIGLTTVEYNAIVGTP